MAVGARFCFELLDPYIGQFCVMFFPRTSATEFIMQGEWVMEYTQFFVGALTYLQSLTWYY